MQRRGCLLGLASAALAGCAFDVDSDHDGPDAPRAAALPQLPRTAWVLSSGGPRGFVHVGVLKGLDELGLKPDLVVGASIGALVGTLWAAGLPSHRIEALALDLQPWTLARLAPGAAERLSGAALRDWFADHLPQRALQRLPVAAACVALRLSDREPVAFTQGDAALAVQASTAIEGRFAPVRIRGERYADADDRMPLPVRLARALGATRVLAVDASAHEDRAPPGAERWRESDRRKRDRIRPDAARADVLLHPDFGYWVDLSRAFRERAIGAGLQAVRDAAPALRALHAG
ncbi:MAG: patatin-like phospholipase family protein [Rubrivivax sp.]